jgi:glutaredoxin
MVRTRSFWILTFVVLVFGFNDSVTYATEVAKVKTVPAIQIYSASYCGECKRAKAYMEEKGIKFVDYDIESDIEKRREFYARGGRGIPLLIIRGEMMEGFDEELFEYLRARKS